MLNEIVRGIVNDVVPVVVTAGVTVAVAAIKSVGTAVVSLIQAKKDAAIAKMGAEQYNNELAISKNIWNIGDEFFRTNPQIEKTIEAAQAKFKEEILKKLPYLSDEDIDHLRQAVAGEVNKGREVITAPAKENVTNTEATTTTAAQ